MFNNVGNMGLPLPSLYLLMYHMSSMGTHLCQLRTRECSIYHDYSNHYEQYLWILSTGAGRLSTKDALNVVFHMPMVYAIPLALLCQLLPFVFTGSSSLLLSTSLLTHFVGVAMIALGVKFNRTH